MFRISTITAAVLALSTCLLSSTAAAAPWTFTTTGIIDSGYDAPGIFGRTNANLAGKAYTMVTMMDIEDMSGHFTQPGQQGWFGGTSSAVTQKVTIGRVTRTYEFLVKRHFEGNVVLIADNVRTKAYQYFSGTTSDGDYVWGEHSLMSYANKFITDSKPVQNFAYTTKNNDFGKVHFYQQGYSTTYFESARMSSMSIETVVPAAIPEPASLALLGLGLLGFAVARRVKS